MTEIELRNQIVSTIMAWDGAKKGSDTHHYIIDLYNTIKPLPRGIRMSYTMAWCAAAVSAAFQGAGLIDLIPPECSCGLMLQGAKGMGIWVEDDGYRPQLGDICLYDWQDDGKGDNTGAPDHMGIVTAVGANGFVVTEGNKGSVSEVGIRSITFGGRYIRGFICPRYAEKADKPTGTGKAVAKIPLGDIERIEVVFSEGRSLAQIRSDTGADYVINGGLYDMGTNKPVCHLKIDGKPYATEPWCVWGYQWDSGADINMVAIPKSATMENYITCLPLLTPLDGIDAPLVYDKGALGGVRGRTAMALTKDNLILYCSEDGTGGAKTPEGLRQELYDMGAVTAIMLDGGGSSQCDLNGQVIQASRKVNNYICVWTNKREDKPWYQDAMDWAKTSGIMDGARPMDNLTRAEAAVMLRRLYQLLKGGG